MTGNQNSKVDQAFPHIEGRILDEDLLQTRRRFLADVATRLFAQEGYHGTTVDDIAVEAKISVGSIYRYVGRKPDILLLIFRELADQYDAELKPLSELNTDPKEKLRQGIYRYYRVIDQHPEMAIIAYRESWVLEGEARDYIMQRELRTNEYLERILQEGIDSETFRPFDPHLVSYDVIILGHMWALKGWHFRRRMTVEEYAEQQAELLLTALQQ